MIKKEFKEKQSAEIDPNLFMKNSIVQGDIATVQLDDILKAVCQSNVLLERLVALFSVHGYNGADEKIEDLRRRGIR